MAIRIPNLDPDEAKRVAKRKLETLDRELQEVLAREPTAEGLERQRQKDEQDAKKWWVKLINKYGPKIVG